MRSKSSKAWISTSMTSLVLGACITCSAFVMNSLAWAEDGAQSTDSQPETKSVVNPENKPEITSETKPEIKPEIKSETKKKAKGGKGTREKDADGSEAPDRFKADTVIKSQYKLNGQPLEVDPD